MEKELRRNQISLVTLGTGIILFGVWSVGKTLLYYVAGPKLELDLEGDPRYILIVEIVVFGFLGLLLLADLLLRVYVGRAARAEGMGRQQKNRYLYIAGLMILFSALSALSSLYYAVNGTDTGQSRMDFAVSFVVDLTSVAMLVRLIVTARRARRLRTALEG